MAKRRKGRPVNGILLLNKPYDISSNKALQQVKSIYFAQKAGHTGALDPLATGMLPICLGEATKFSQFLLDTDKRYRVTARLGVRTTTSDADGEIVSERPVSVTLEQLEQALEQFKGIQQQVPSMYSALKYQGQPLYKYAREGIEVPRESREITVYELQLLAANLTDEIATVELEVHCSKGTYIRTIIDDLGEVLGCGAYVSALHRLTVGHYPVEKMVTLEQLEQKLAQARDEGIAPSEFLDPLLLPMETAVVGLPEVSVDITSAQYLRLGNPVLVPNAPTEGMVQIFTEPNHHFIGVGQINEQGLVAPKRIVVEH
jgi:tRNA pseudouridine55 synthase